MKMLNIVKSGTEMIDDISTVLPKSLLFWGVVGAAVASSSVMMIRPLRRSLLALLGFKVARKVAKRVARQASSRTSRQSTAHRVVRHAASRKPRLAHAR